jgi:hypothetical protein
MKTKITLKTNDNEEIDAIINRHKYKQFHDELYDEVFRKVIRYSEDEKLVSCYERVWKEIYEHMSKL